MAEVDRYKAAKLGETSPLAASSINKTLQTLAAVLEVAVERDQLSRKTAAGRRRRVRAKAPRRFCLDTADHIAALLEAAGELDAKVRDDRRLARRALLAALVFGGLRIGEALDLRWRDVDLAAGRLRIVDARPPPASGTCRSCPPSGRNYGCTAWRRTTRTRTMWSSPTPADTGSSLRTSVTAR